MKTDWTASDNYEEMQNLNGICHIDSMVWAPGVYPSQPALTISVPHYMHFILPPSSSSSKIHLSTLKRGLNYVEHAQAARTDYTSP